MVRRALIQTVAARRAGKLPPVIGKKPLGTGLIVLIFRKEEE